MNISTLLPVKNGEKFVGNILKTLSSSCRNSDEILVIDDFSEDKTTDIVYDFARTDNRIKLIKNKSNGIVNALNLGIREASNTWIARYDVDDNYSHKRIEEQRKLVSDNLVAIFSDYSFFSETNSNLGTIPSAVEASSVAISLISSQRTAHPSVFFNKEAVLSVGSYREQDFPAEDLSLWLRMSRIGEMVSVPKTLLRYRLSANSITGMKRRDAINKKEELLQNIDIVINNFSDIVKDYGLLELQTERELLLVRDLYMLSKNRRIKHSQSKKINHIVLAYGIKNFLRVSKLRSIRKLQVEKKSREIERLIQHPHNFMGIKPNLYKAN
jgi:glycosyltransferase involved in cell wall biosynthesis